MSVPETRSKLVLYAEFIVSVFERRLVRYNVLRANGITMTQLQMKRIIGTFSLYLLRCPDFRADLITAVKARSLDVFIQSLLKIGTGRSPCRPVDMINFPDWVLVLMMAIPLALICLVLFCYLTGQTTSDVRKDGSGVDGEVRNTNELQGKDEVLHDKPNYDRAAI